MQLQLDFDFIQVFHQSRRDQAACPPRVLQSVTGLRHRLYFTIRLLASQAELRM